MRSALKQFQVQSGAPKKRQFFGIFRREGGNRRGPPRGSALRQSLNINNIYIIYVNNAYTLTQEKNVQRVPMFL